MNHLSPTDKVIRWIGSIQSLVAHTAFFIVMLLLGIFGFDWGKDLLILTTVVSLEAIYLAIFIQLTVNRNTASLQEVEKDIDEIQEDIAEVSESTEEPQVTIESIQAQLQHLLAEVETLKQQKHSGK